jgi:hypothetical protein
MVLLICGPAHGWWVVIGHGLSFDVSVSGDLAAACAANRELNARLNPCR